MNTPLWTHWSYFIVLFYTSKVHPNWFFNIYHGKLVKEHPQECQ